MLYYTGNTLFAQESLKPATSKTIVLSPGITYQHLWSGSLTVSYAGYDFEPCGYSAVGAFVGTEFLYKDSRFIYAPKIGYQLAGMGLCLRVAELNYIDGNSVDVRLLPEIGFDFLTRMNVCYGYNIHLFGDKLHYISDHRVTLMINFAFDVKKKKG